MGVGQVSMASAAMRYERNRNGSSPRTSISEAMSLKRLAICSLVIRDLSFRNAAQPAGIVKCARGLVNDEPLVSQRAKTCNLFHSAVTYLKMDRQSAENAVRIPKGPFNHLQEDAMEIISRLRNHSARLMNDR